MLYMKRRAKGAALPYSTCCHTSRATGITTYLQNAGTWSMPRPSRIMNRREPPSCTIPPVRTFDEVERLKI
jgi:hypothetical protein